MTDEWSAAWDSLTTPAQHPFDRGECEPTDGPTCWDVGIDLDAEVNAIFGPQNTEEN